MAPTRRDALRTAALLCGLGGLAGCAAEDSPSTNETSRGEGRPTTQTAVDNSSPTAERTPTPTTTERPPAEPTRPGGTTKSEQPTASATDATSSYETSPKSPGAPPLDGQVRSIGGVRVAVSNPVTRKAVAYQPIIASGGVLVRSDRQFVVAAVRSAANDGYNAAAPPALDSFSLVAGGETFSAAGTKARTTGAYTGSLAGRGTVGYAASRAEYRSIGWVVFEPPSPLESEKATIRCRHDGETATWSLPRVAIETLAKPAPSFELRTFSAERNGSEVELSLVAANTSDVDGAFLAAVYWPTTAIADDDESTIVRREVAAGDHVEWSKTVSTSATGGGEDDTVTARVDGVVTGEATVAVPRTTV